MKDRKDKKLNAEAQRKARAKSNLIPTLLPKRRVLKSLSTGEGFRVRFALQGEVCC
jgi:hypothetical protein